eukprot:1021410-Pelagomonas_calceolata.AAC.3
MAHTANRLLKTAMTKIWEVDLKRSINPFELDFREHSAQHSGVSAGQRDSPPPRNAVGVPVSSVVCCEGGLLTAGADGAVLHHRLRKP